MMTTIIIISKEEKKHDSNKSFKRCKWDPKRPPGSRSAIKKIKDIFYIYINIIYNIIYNNNNLLIWIKVKR